MGNKMSREEKKRKRKEQNNESMFWNILDVAFDIISFLVFGIFRMIFNFLLRIFD